MLIAVLINGLLMGGVYALVAVGLTLIFGVMKIINFAHGTLMMLGMYVTYWLFALFALDPYLSILVCAPLLFLFGVFLQRFLIGPILDAAEQNQILLTVGISIIIENLALFIWSPDFRTIKSSLSGVTFPVGEFIMVSAHQLVAFVVALAVTGILYLFLKKTDSGKAMRACSEEKEGALLMGINVNRIYLLAFGIGSACVGVAGTLVLPFFYVSPDVGYSFILIAFIVVVLGGMGNFVGALLGGLAIGLAESMGILIIKPSMRQLIPFGIFILVLFFKPEGLFSRKER
jgi:branched-chain amino acid transport system permease protein